MSLIILLIWICNTFVIVYIIGQQFLFFHIWHLFCFDVYGAIEMFDFK